MHNCRYFLFFLFVWSNLQAQVYGDYVGAGHTEGVSVFSSSSSGTGNAQNTVDGSGLGIDAPAAARFLNYASLGADYETI